MPTDLELRGLVVLAHLHLPVADAVPVDDHPGGPLAVLLVELLQRAAEELAEAVDDLLAGLL